METVGTPSGNRGWPIGGWLILPAIGTATGPFALVYYAVKEFQSIAAEEPELFDSAWFYLVYGIESLLLVFSLFVAVLFFGRKRLLPVVMQAYLVTTVVGAVTMQTLNYLLLESDYDFKALSKVIISALIWIPYFSISKRVEATFVN